MNLFELFVKIGVKDEASGTLSNLSSKLGSGLKTAAEVGLKAIGAVSAGVAALGSYAVNVGMSFESQMSKVSAISGSTGEALEALVEKAQEMGIKTKFSATEAGQAFEYMAMAGWKTEQMLSGIEGIMNLSAASGEDLAKVSDIVTDAMTAFGLAADQSSHFSDVLAIASSNANTNVGLMGETFQYVAPVAGALKFSIEDTAMAIGLMANSGIKGSQAGTALRSVFTRLLKPTTEVSIAMEAIGLEVTNADGSMRSLSEIMEDLRTGFDGLTDAEKAEYAANIAGQEAMSGLLAIVNATTEDFNKLQTAVYNADGAAQQMAETMADNLGGQLTLLKSSAEGFGLALYEWIEEPLKNVVSWSLDGLNSLTQALQENGVDGVVETIGDLLGEGFAALTRELPDLAGISLSVINSFVDGITDNSDVISEGVVSLITILVDKLASEETLSGLLNAGANIVVSLANAISENAPEIARGAANIVISLAETLTDPDSISALTDAGVSLVEALADSVIDAAPLIARAVPSIFENIGSAAERVSPKFRELGSGIFDSIAEGFAEKSTSADSSVQSGILSYISSAVEFSSILSRFGLVDIPVVSTFDELANAADTAASVFEEAQTAISVSAKLLSGDTVGAWEEIKAEFSDWKETWNLKVEELGNAFSSVGSRLSSALGPVVDSIKGAFINTFDSIKLAWGELIGTITGDMSVLSSPDLFANTRIPEVSPDLYNYATSGSVGVVGEATQKNAGSQIGLLPQTTINQYISTNPVSAADLLGETMYRAKQEVAFGV